MMNTMFGRGAAAALRPSQQNATVAHNPRFAEARKRTACCILLCMNIPPRANPTTKDSYKNNFRNCPLCILETVAEPGPNSGIHSCTSSRRRSQNPRWSRSRKITKVGSPGPCGLDSPAQVRQLPALRPPLIVSMLSAPVARYKTPSSKSYGFGSWKAPSKSTTMNPLRFVRVGEQSGIRAVLHV